MRKTSHLWLYFATAVALGLQSCSRNPVTGKKEIIFMSQEQEIALGAQSHPSIVATMGLYEDAKLQNLSLIHI